MSELTIADPRRLWFDRLFDGDSFFGTGLLASPPTPPLNVAETDKAIVVSVELPGMNEKDVTVQMIGDQLTISGEKTCAEETKDQEFTRIECRYGAFSRSVRLGQHVSPSGVEAVYKNGVLTVTIPKLAPSPAERIKVRKE